MPTDESGMKVFRCKNVPYSLYFVRYRHINLFFSVVQQYYYFLVITKNRLP